MDNQTKPKIALKMLPVQLRRPILLTLLMIAALMMITKPVLPNRMDPKMPSYVTKTKNNLDIMTWTKRLTRFSYDNKKVTHENSKKNLEKIKRTKCLTSYIIENECKKDAIKKREKNDSKNSKKESGKNKEDKVPYQFCH